MTIRQLHPVTEQDRNPPPLSEWERLTGIFWQPQRVFDDLRSRPRWLAPILLSTGIASATYYYVLLQDGRVLEDLIASDFFLILSGPGRPVLYFALAIAVLRIQGLLLGGILRLVRQPVRYRQPESIVSYASLPFSLLRALEFCFLVAMDVWGVDLDNPLDLSVAWVLGRATTPPWLYTVASTVSVFSLWYLWLLALGASTVRQGWSVQAALLYLAPVWMAYWSFWAFVIPALMNAAIGTH